MARRARNRYTDAVNHVMVRGNDGQDIFLDESNYLHFYNLLEKGVNRLDVRISALGLMSNYADGIRGAHREEF